MTKQEEIFFRQIEEKSKEEPMIKVEYAAKEIAMYIQEYCMDEERRVKGDLWLYLASVLGGISCIKASKASFINIPEKRMDDEDFMPLVEIDTKMGKFYIGDLINEYLINGQFSLVNVYCVLCTNTHKDFVMPDIKAAVEKNSSNMGKEDFRIWNNVHNPYEEKEMFMKVYNEVKKHIVPFKIEEEMMPTVFGFVISEITDKVAGIFPKNLNCYEMTIEAVLFNAHMDY